MYQQALEVFFSARGATGGFFHMIQPHRRVWDSRELQTCTETKAILKNPLDFAAKLLLLVIFTTLA
jgi:hypothetical protein